MTFSQPSKRNINIGDDGYRKCAEKKRDRLLSLFNGVSQSHGADGADRWDMWASVIMPVRVSGRQ